MMRVIIFLILAKILPSNVEANAVTKHKNDIDMEDNNGSVKYIILMIYFIVLPAMVVMATTRG